jgi:putative spermidine/putrescine transport system permease protein
MRQRKPTRQRVGPAVAITLAVFLFEFFPIAVVIWASFGSASYVEIPPKGLTLHWYHDLFHDGLYLSPLLLSITLASASVLISVVLAAPSAYALVRFKLRFRRVLEAITLMPVIVPEIVLAIAILQLASFLGGRQAIWLALAGHTTLVFPFILRTTVSSLSSLDGDVEEAAIGLGASRLTAFRRVILPHAKVGLVAGSILGFIISMDAFFMSLFLSNQQTLPLIIWETLRFDFNPSVLALSSFLILFTLISLIFIDRLVGLGSVLGVGRIGRRQD